ncbi:MAG: hypothetical protein UX01_C0013G0021 [Candidatus Collierbacteria bacterium GW2011_GWB2_45_17]|uniref:Band 7 domain-containing protein n=2 Tax=Candidatus Collieribacteriota TaxID=1752725 RepID=A0A0G1KNZ1_9BACT|nr:MAG: hypothetical protein UW48_C0012G0021 [Microgenomates group bacterium GW2011_GWC1_44_23]KKT85238.1 MAG: hypothetical protein UW84_C0039G0007 [Candidatus Collierbacteria bacterium GW2011_GWA2_44_99]KKT94920.1 MAG: hypothetical protein UW96_C0013G0021 [Candidatus Collierbacteria bacterium GW2011_GWA1_45_15]KKT99102.1 MAG: hypothetical protein UX01_C0013G0021 [Candidatus Collierbacteria bacterium GW2011_GWB2_45_17]KKU07646.1 MAG: hypothetical protein UX11_C0012G0021 [Candidatus Collierbacte
MRKVALFMFALSFALTGCFINDDVQTDQSGVIVDGGKITECVGPGVYTRWGFFEDLVEVSNGTVTFEVSDPQVATKDSQLVSVIVTIQARRNADCDSLKNLLTNWPALIDDTNLINTITATTNEAIKVGTRQFDLTQLLNDRVGLSSAVETALENDSNKYSTTIINVTIKDVGLDPAYAEVLQKKALLTVQIEAALREQDLIKQQAANDKLAQEQRTLVSLAQLDAEKAVTAVQVEIATRAGNVVEAANNVYLINPAAFELEKLRLLKEVLGDKAVIYFVNENTDLTLLLSNIASGQVVPVAPNGATQP